MRRSSWRRVLGIVLTLGLLSGMVIFGLNSQSCQAAPPRPEDANVNWQKFTGKTIDVMGVAGHPWTESLRPLLPEFEKLTGMKVLLDVYGEAEYMKKAEIEISSGSPRIESFMILQFYGVEFIEAGWVELLNPYLNDPELTDKEWYDYEDFPELQLSQLYPGKTYGIAEDLSPQIFWYRKDLYEQAGLSVPETFPEFYEGLKKIHNPPEVFGTAETFKRGEASAWAWNGFVCTYGGRWIDKDNNVRIHTPESIEATDMYIKLARDYGPRGVVNYGWYECVSDMQQGKAATILHVSAFLGALKDPQKSRVAEKIGAAIVPASPTGHRAPAANTAWILCMSPYTPDKEAAWLFIEWATSKYVQTKAGIQTGNFARLSVWDDPEFQKTYPHPDWIKATKDTIVKYKKDFWLPMIPKMGAAMEVMNAALQEMLLGGSIEEVLMKAQKETEKLL